MQTALDYRLRFIDRCFELSKEDTCYTTYRVTTSNVKPPRPYLAHKTKLDLPDLALKVLTIKMPKGRNS